MTQPPAGSTASQDALAGIPRWAVGSALLAPIALIGGFLYAGAQVRGFDPLRATISDLAATELPNRATMTTALIVTGVAHLATALGLKPVSRLGRGVLALGGLATLIVAGLPVGGPGSSSPGHVAAALVSFAALSIWPRFIVVREPAAPFVLRPTFTSRASALMLACLALTVVLVVLPFPGAPLGLVERILASLNALCPLAVVLGLRRVRGMALNE